MVTEQLLEVSTVPQFIEQLERDKVIRVIYPGQCFGSLERLTGELWKPLTRIFALQECQLITIARDYVTQMYAEYELSLKTETLIGMLQSQIPGFDKLSHTRKVKIAQAFKEV